MAFRIPLPICLPPEMTWPCGCHCGLITSVSRSPLQMEGGTGSRGCKTVAHMAWLWCSHIHLSLRCGPANVRTLRASGTAPTPSTMSSTHLSASSILRRSGSVSAVGKSTAPRRSLCHAAAHALRVWSMHGQRWDPCHVGTWLAGLGQLPLLAALQSTTRSEAKAVVALSQGNRSRLPSLHRTVTQTHPRSPPHPAARL